MISCTLTIHTNQTIRTMMKSNGYNPAIHHRHSIRLKGYDYSRAGFYFITICVGANNDSSQLKFFRPHIFGKVVDGKMILSDVGKIATQCWEEIPKHFPNAILHEYVIMPNHVHGIIQLMNNSNKNEIYGVTGSNAGGAKKNENGGAKNGENDGGAKKNGMANVGANNYSPLLPPPTSPLPPPTAYPSPPTAYPSPSLPARFVPNGTSRTIGSIVRGFKIGVSKQLGYSVWQRNYWEVIIRKKYAYQRIANYIIKNPQKWWNDRFNKKINNKPKHIRL